MASGSLIPMSTLAAFSRVLMDTDLGWAQIELPLGGTLRVPAGQTVLEALQAERQDLRQPVILVVNGQTEDITYRLRAGDSVRLIPQIAGG
jgi:hypothetical protein